MSESDELLIPDAAASDPQSFELVRAWIANKAVHVSLRAGVWKDPAAYGILLCDLMRHIADAYYQDQGLNPAETLGRIKAGLEAELSSPTDTPSGHLK